MQIFPSALTTHMYILKITEIIFIEPKIAKTQLYSRSKYLKITQKAGGSKTQTYRVRRLLTKLT